MSHLFVCRGGTHFKFSHGFGNLLTSQLKATCEGEDVDHRICINKYKGNTIVWPDLSADDYINYPITTSIEHLCSYVFTMLYKKIFNSLKQVEYIEIAPVPVLTVVTIMREALIMGVLSIIIKI